ncbi:DUF2442 domain-containing protein [Prosthecomicrobium pneumaticum]|uniref:DUF2442 domain-containing protein n=1 Tax=Prosthecomicrobium pneumaticum TaxID=81895 RepID=A0A7W9FLH1_9HYPH|nr:DUF2442 domain-containing protein [Prosthecomicrobium pneumaticum]MBB5752847.1 hypothetical protein [Prosthecomicrobium pneumaticum]
MIEMIKVVKAEAVGDHLLHVVFSNGSEGVHDFADIVGEEGPMVEPLRDAAFFARVYLDYGAPSWPNGFDVDAIWLHDAMKALGLLRPAAA